MSFSDFFGAISYAVIVVTVTPDIHPPLIENVHVFQTFSTLVKNNLTVQAYVWDLNNISSIKVEWGVGNPNSTDFVSANKTMIQTNLANFYEAGFGEYSHGSVVWYRLTAIDNSSASNVEETQWMSVTVVDMSHVGAPAIFYAAVIILGSLALIVFVVIYFRTKVR